MKTFIEVIGKDPVDDIGTLPMIEKVDVKGANPSVIMANLKLQYPKATIRKHFCYHDEIPVKPCTIEEIK